MIYFVLQWIHPLFIPTFTQQGTQINWSRSIIWSEKKYYRFEKVFEYKARTLQRIFRFVAQQNLDRYQFIWLRGESASRRVICFLIYCDEINTQFYILNVFSIFFWIFHAMISIGIYEVKISEIDPSHQSLRFYITSYVT